VAHETAATRGVFDFVVLRSNGVDSLFFASWDGGFYGYANIITHIANEPKYSTPQHFSLQQNFPNPFNSETTIQFNVARSSHVTIDIHDLLGRPLQTIIDGNLVAGQYSARIVLPTLPSGIYWCRMRAGNFVETKKLLLLR
jgi:hypothetical protein